MSSRVNAWTKSNDGAGGFAGGSPTTAFGRFVRHDCVAARVEREVWAAVSCTVAAKTAATRVTSATFLTPPEYVALACDP